MLPILDLVICLILKYQRSKWCFSCFSDSANSCLRRIWLLGDSFWINLHMSWWLVLASFSFPFSFLFKKAEKSYFTWSFFYVFPLFSLFVNYCWAFGLRTQGSCPQLVLPGGDEDPTQPLGGAPGSHWLYRVLSLIITGPSGLSERSCYHHLYWDSEK